jgi:hypothetical protein
MSRQEETVGGAGRPSWPAPNRQASNAFSPMCFFEAPAEATRRNHIQRGRSAQERSKSGPDLCIHRAAFVAGCWRVDAYTHAHGAFQNPLFSRSICRSRPMQFGKLWPCEHQVHAT